MDDYNVNVLSEAKNEYSSRLVTILTPLIIEGIKSIFEEAMKLCLDNDEEEKYLMTFQNFLSRVPKWNAVIVEEETKRIVKKSQCEYLEDLLTCVHITQLKILTSIRVSQKQKKIDIDIPKLTEFVHKCYISYARKLYSNVYLFENNVLPLNYQKNMREAELMCQESILNVIRENMPVETILRAYIDETVDEEIIEETIEKTVDEEEKKQLEKELEETPAIQDGDSGTITKKEDTVTLEKPELSENKPEKPVENVKLDTVKETPNTENSSEQNINLIIQTPTMLEDKKETLTPTPTVVAKPLSPKESVVNKLKFNDKDSVLDMGTNKSTEVEAPKTLERLEKISKEANEKRKAEEAEYDDDDDDYDDAPIKIFNDTNLELDKIDIHNLDKKLKLESPPILDDIEVLG